MPNWNGDWKGSLVRIQVWSDDWTNPVTSLKRFLDTDTMVDLFTRYNPLEYKFEIEPLVAEEEYEDGADSGTFITDGP